MPARVAQYHVTWQRLKRATEIERELIDRLGQVIEARRHALDRESMKQGNTGAVLPPRAAKVCQ